MRHYFSGIDIDSLDDEKFAILFNDAQWLHAQQLMSQQVKTLGMVT